MNQQKLSMQIGVRSFLQALVILFILMMLAGVLTRVLPAGAYQRAEREGRLVVVPDSFRYIERPEYPIWRWFVAPLEVLGGPNGPTIIVILIFILLIGMAFAVLDRSGLLAMGVGQIVRRFGERKYPLLLAISLFFMAIGAFFGIFEEVVPLVPLMLALSYMLGWDALVGLGMSILAVNMGFSAAITNPFTIGVAQRLAGLPLFSGALLRLFIFATIYAVFVLFLTRYARRVEREPTSSLVFQEDQATRSRFAETHLGKLAEQPPASAAGLRWLLVFLVLIVMVLLAAPFVPLLSDLSMPFIGLLFFVGGVGAALRSGVSRRLVGETMLDGLRAIAPAMPLILMAASVGYIVWRGGVLDTILYRAAQPFAGLGPFAAALFIYLVALVLEIFIASGSAKAFLVMPVLLPLADLAGVTYQTVVTAYCFGDGFSNLAYPTNPVLLICLGLASVSYPKWMRWTLRLWFWVILVSVAFLGLAVAIRFGPF